MIPWRGQSLKPGRIYHRLSSLTSIGHDQLVLWLADAVDVSPLLLQTADYFACVALGSHQSKCSLTCTF
ncbi:hypothetical protein CC2G_006017 [Coprinopsis cinerea AmutBmut pab1-1]|nr:hypothetical protein CC2G_006017 [Coprinopsis cinerea AmutBmut pab1-1]